MTDFLRNSWYCAGWSAELGNEPKSIKIMNQDIVLFRTSNGLATALDNRCRHRSAPLSRGCVKGDVIECPYHGLQFNRDGQCTLNPHGSGEIPPNAHTRSYPLEERDGALWVWMGNPEKADPTFIIDLYFNPASEAWNGDEGYLHVNAGYQLVIDNLLDLTHTSYVHSASLGIDIANSPGASLDVDFRKQDKAIIAEYVFRNAPGSISLAAFYTAPRMDTYSRMAWYPAASLIQETHFTEVGADKQSGIAMPAAHLIVPETEHSCHYFYRSCHNSSQDIETKNSAMKKTAIEAFVNEDEPLIGACHEQMAGQELFELKPAILQTDVAGVLARKLLKKLIHEEMEQAEPQPQDK